MKGEGWSLGPVWVGLISLVVATVSFFVGVNQGIEAAPEVAAAERESAESFQRWVEEESEIRPWYPSDRYEACDRMFEWAVDIIDQERMEQMRNEEPIGDPYRDR
ncbi:hypothetical protein [Rhodovulum euryhalinum]|uniref:hypothetical protein n=1 Tax=Rhodovulum euryhalinum TaxID=35805 RepID=UPI00104DC2CB|nr:hypothetical protein [Rhodovulum euryhalinum]